MSDYQTEKKRREVQIRTQVTQKLEDSGEREKLKEVLRGRLRECGWRDQLKEHCRGVISQKGLSNVTVDGLVEEITPKARSTVPDAVKKELLQHIRDYLEKQT